MTTDLQQKIFDISEDDFNETALEVFRFQSAQNVLYRNYINCLHRDADQIDHYTKIPFLPVSFFKTHAVSSSTSAPEKIFESSGTTGSVNSKHFIKDIKLYEQSFIKSFSKFYGDIKDYCVLGLLPSYLERNNSSLIYMVDELIKKSGNAHSGFFLYDQVALANTLMQLEREGKKTLLIGVTYALLDFAEAHPIQLNHTIVMETGGMKGRKKEMTRTEVHAVLKEKFGLKQVHAEYGMTELLSQAYALADGKFNTPPWMKVVARAEDDPFEIKEAGDRSVTGVANIIDLANLHSCSFIATDDMIRLHPDHSFEVLGSLDNSDIRGCSLLLVN